MFGGVNALYICVLQSPLNVYTHSCLLRLNTSLQDAQCASKEDFYLKIIVTPRYLKTNFAQNVHGSMQDILRCFNSYRQLFVHIASD